MKTDIERLKERFANANTEAEIEAVDKEMKACGRFDRMHQGHQQRSG